MNTLKKLDELTFSSMYNIMQSGMWLLNDLETYLRPLGMSQARLTVLLMLENSKDPMINPKDIARITGKSRPAVTRMIEKLSQDGLLSIHQDTFDGRSKMLRLTEVGKNVLQKIIPKYNARVIRMSSSLTDVEKQQINILLRKINFIDSKKVLS